LTQETLLEAADTLDFSPEKRLDNLYEFPWQQQEFVVKNYNLRENVFGKYLQNMLPKLLDSRQPVLMDWDAFYFDLASAFLQAHRQIGQQLDAIPCVRTLTRQEIFKRISMAHQFILEHFAQPIALEDLEKVALFSRFHVIRLYRHLYGLTPYQHIL